MRTLVFLLADYANIAEGGKLNVMGIFNRISAARFPALHPTMHLVIKLAADLGETDEERVMVIKLLDEDGQELLNVSGQIRFPRVSPGEQAEVNAILALNTLVFPHPGKYEFVLLVDKEHKGRAPITLCQIEDRPSDNGNGEEPE